MTHTHAGTDCYDPDCVLDTVKSAAERSRIRREYPPDEVARLVRLERLLREARKYIPEHKLYFKSDEEDRVRLIACIDEMLGEQNYT